MTGLEDLKRRERHLSLLFRLFFVVMLLLVVLIAGWLFAYLDQPAKAFGMTLMQAAGSLEIPPMIA